jgi:chemotaxis protein histidine kinase CheA
VDQLKDRLDSLADLEDSQVSEFQKEIISEFESVEKQELTPQTVDAMTSLADMLDSVNSEIKRREAQAIELSQKAAEAAARVYGQDGDTEEEKMDEAEVMPSEETPVEEPSEEKKMDEAADMDKKLDMEDDNSRETEEIVDMPLDEEDVVQEDEEKKTMAEASTNAEKTVELSTETETVTEAAPVAKETVVAAAEETAEVAKEEAVVASAEDEESSEEEAAPAEEVAEEAPAAEEAAEEVAEDATADAAADVEDGSEAAIQETQTAQTVQEETMEAPVTAAADNADNLNIEVPADRRPTSRTSAAPVAITAGADIPGYTAGSTLEDMSAVAEAMSKRLHALRRVNGGDGEQHIVASFSTEYPEDRQLTTDPQSNWDKIQAVAGPEAIVAAGGHVAPFEARYDVFGLGTTVRPVRDALPRFQADRGGIRFVTPPVLSEYGDAVGVWTAANDSAETPSPAAKASLVVTSAQEEIVSTDAVTLQMQFGNLMTRAYPELIARHNELGLIQHAREAEQYILSQIAADSTAVSTSSLIGFGRDFLVQVGRAAAAYRSRHRMEADASIRVIAPSWVRDAMQADLALNMPGDNNLAASASEIDGYLSARNVNISYSLDQNVFGAQGAGALVEFSDSFTWYLFAEGTFLFLDGGTLDLGIIRDSSLVGTNDYKMFIETFENVAKVGVEGLAITSAISVNGVAAALRDTTGGASAAAIEY